MPVRPQSKANFTTAQNAHIISESAAAVGFDWPAPMDVLDKLAEEITEIRLALQNHESRDRIEEEVGDLYFALVNFNRKMQIDSDKAFQSGVDKFQRRFNALCQHIENNGQNVSDLTADELESVWQLVKQEENNAKQSC